MKNSNQVEHLNDAISNVLSLKSEKIISDS